MSKKGDNMTLFSNILGFETPVDNSFPLFGIKGADGQPFEVYFYGAVIVAAILLATLISMLIMHRRNISSDNVLAYFIVVIPSAIVAARGFACIMESGLTLMDFFDFRSGGLSILGGLIGAFVSAIIYSVIAKVDFFRIADSVIPTVPLAQAIGRWGNYFNQEVYGGIVAEEWMKFFPFAVKIASDGQWHYAFFFYESVVNTVWFVLLFLFAWNFFKKPSGIVLCLYCILYGVLRAIMEPLRDSSYQYGGGTGVDFSSVMAYVLIIGGAVLLATLLLLNKKKEGKYIGSKNGDEYVITNFLPSEKGELPLYSDINAATKLLNKNVK